MRTWMDARLTSSRIVHPFGRRCCAFGCVGATDALRHYVYCRPLHVAVRRALARPFPLPVLE
eukprot:3707655-Pyramimonas_sp.AAC.1